MTNAKSTTTTAAAKRAAAKPAAVKRAAASPKVSVNDVVDSLNTHVTVSEMIAADKDDQAVKPANLRQSKREQTAAAKRAAAVKPAAVKPAAVKPAAVKPAAVKRSTPVDVSTLTGASELYWPCANCDAAPGARCTQKSGRVKTYFHADRAHSVELFAKYGISDAKKLAAAAAKDAASSK